MSAGSGPTRAALIVAVSDYRDPRLQQLRAPAADADRLAAVLRDPEVGGFEVEVLRNPEEGALRRRLATFFGPERRPDDLLLVHFSCHGVKDEGGELYLASADTEKDLLDATGIAATWLNQRIGRCRSRRIVVLLDCCFSGSFPFGMHARAGDEVNVQEHLEGRGRAVITASNSMEYAYEGDQLTGHGQPSVFTDAVVEGLATGRADRDGDKRISIQELYDYVFDRVKETQPAQTPNMMSTLEGPLHIARSSYEPPVEPAKLDQQLLGLVDHPLADARVGAVDALRRLLGSPDPSVRLAAQLTLERMQNDDSRRVASLAKAALAHVISAEKPRVDEADQEQLREVEVEAGAKTAVTSNRVVQEVDPGIPTPSPARSPEAARPWWRAGRLVLVSTMVLLAGFAVAYIPSEASADAAGLIVLTSLLGYVAAIVVALSNRSHKR